MLQHLSNLESTQIVCSWYKRGQSSLKRFTCVSSVLFSVFLLFDLWMLSHHEMLNNHVWGKDKELQYVYITVMGCKLQVGQAPDSILSWEFIWGLPYPTRTWGIEVWSQPFKCTNSKGTQLRWWWAFLPIYSVWTRYWPGLDSEMSHFYKPDLMPVCLYMYR